MCRLQSLWQTIIAVEEILAACGFGAMGSFGGGRFSCGLKQCATGQTILCRVNGNQPNSRMTMASENNFFPGLGNAYEFS